MSGFTVLTPVTFINAETSAGAYPWFECDYRMGGDRMRTVIGIRSDLNAAVALEVKISATRIQPGMPTNVIATATVWTSANTSNNSCVLLGAFTHVRCRKIGVSGSATFVGIV